MVIWIIGLSGSGKTTLAKDIINKTKKKLSNIVLLDGDIIRDVFANDIGHSISDRLINAQRINRLCKMFEDQGIHVIASILSIFPESREWNRKNLMKYYEVYIDAPIEQLKYRDDKGLYKKFDLGEINNLAGMDLEFLPPKNSDLIINNNRSLNELLSHSEFLSSLFK